jgi:hypothetical protein
MKRAILTYGPRFVALLAVAGASPLVVVAVSACSGSTSYSSPQCGTCGTGQVCVLPCAPDGFLPASPTAECDFPGDGGVYHRGSPDGATVLDCPTF